MAERSGHHPRALSCRLDLPELPSTDTQRKIQMTGASICYHDVFITCVTRFLDTNQQTSLLFSCASSKHSLRGYKSPHVVCFDLIPMSREKRHSTTDDYIIRLGWQRQRQHHTFYLVEWQGCRREEHCFGYGHERPLIPV